MTLSTFSLTRPSALSAPQEPLWGSADQLVVVVSPPTEEDLEDYLIAYGIDPTEGLGDYLIAYGIDPALEVDTLLFERMLPSSDLGVFLSVLVGGPDFSSGVVALTLSGVSRDSSGPVIANSVDVSNSLPPAPGPKLTVVFALARSIADDKSLAVSDRPAA